MRRYTLGGQTLCRKARQIELAIKAIEIRNQGKSATLPEIAKELDVSLDKLNKMLTDVSRSFLISLDEPTYVDDSKTSFSDTIEDNRLISPDQFIENKEQQKIVRDIVQELPNQEKQVLVLYYFEELTLREIGVILKVSESRVSQIHTKAIIRLRSRLRQLNYSY